MLKIFHSMRLKQSNDPSQFLLLPHQKPAMETELQMQPDIDEDQKENLFKKDLTSCYICIAVTVVVVILCCSSVGIGIGYGIWNNGYTTSQHTTPGASRRTPESAERWTDIPCVTDSQPVCPPGVDRPPLILVALDGFRADYLDRELTPHIKRLSECGTHAPYILPSFPSITFPNLYTIVTGLYPEHSGLVASSMFDPVQGTSYYIGSSETRNKAWYNGEPIWNTAKKNGLRTGCYFWVGSEADIQDMRPDYFFIYTADTTAEQKIDVVRGWLQLPTGKRPDFITLYFREPDHQGHLFGPDSNQVNDKLREIDKYLGDLMDMLVETNMHRCANIIVLADHGMANRSCNQSIILGDKNGINFPTSEYYSRNAGGCMMRYSPKPGIAVLTEAKDIVDRLKCRDPNVVPYAKEDMPKRLHYMNSRRIEEVLIPVKQGYTITNTHNFKCGGGHGYDNLATQMQALFLAYGPAFKKNLQIEPFQNIELFNMMCDVLGIPPPSNDGEYGLLHQILEKPPPLPPIDESNYSTSLECRYPETDQEYAARLGTDGSMCNCDDKLATLTNKTIQAFDEQLQLSASEKTASKLKHALFGVPKVTFKTDFCELVQTDYITAYSHELKMPLYTSYTIDKKVSRDSAPILSCVRPDVRVAASATPDCTDYNIPATEPNATVEFDLTNMTMGFSYSPGLSETLDGKMDALITSNLVPQFLGFIREIEGQYLDYYLPKWADEYNGINVITGPVFDYDLDGLRDPMEVLEEKGQKLNDTMIPTHYFAIITRCSSSDDTNQPISQDCSPLTPLAFILHNKDGIQTCQSLSDYMETNTARVKDVELLTGLQFYSDLDRYQAIGLRTYNVEREHFFKYWDTI